MVLNRKVFNLPVTFQHGDFTKGVGAKSTCFKKASFTKVAASSSKEIQSTQI